MDLADGLFCRGSSVFERSFSFVRSLASPGGLGLVKIPVVVAVIAAAGPFWLSL